MKDNECSTELKKNQKQARLGGCLSGFIGFNYGFMKINQEYFHDPLEYDYYGRRKFILCHATLKGSAYALPSALLFYYGAKKVTKTKEHAPLKQQHFSALMGGFFGFNFGFRAFNRYDIYELRECNFRVLPTLFRAYTAANAGAVAGALLFYHGAKKAKPWLSSYSISIEEKPRKPSVRF